MKTAKFTERAFRKKINPLWFVLGGCFAVMIVVVCWPRNDRDLPAEIESLHDEIRLLIKEGRQLGMGKLLEAEELLEKAFVLLAELPYAEQGPWRDKVKALELDLKDAKDNEKAWSKVVEEKESELESLERRAVSGDDLLQSDVNSFLFSITRLLEENSLRKEHRTTLEGFKDNAASIKEPPPPPPPELDDLLEMDLPLYGPAVKRLDDYLEMNIGPGLREQTEERRKSLRNRANTDFHRRYGGDNLDRFKRKFQGDLRSHFESELDRFRGTPAEDDVLKILSTIPEE